jgi:hypothetical protein
LRAPPDSIRDNPLSLTLRWEFVDENITAINACSSLFLSEIQELDYNGLRLVVREGLPTGEAGPLQVGDAVISGGTRIEVTEESQTFELIWSRYVAYSVLNESFASVDDEERYEGNRFRVYVKSRFIDYVLLASFACADYPGPTQHFAVVCENHVVNVISVVQPTIQRHLQPSLRPLAKPRVM